MKAKTGDPQLDRALASLARTLRGLGGTEDRPIARRNARRRVLGAARALRAQVDDRWPAIVKRTGSKRLKTHAARAARLTGAGWERVDATDEIAAYAAAGVPVRKVSGPAALPRAGSVVPTVTSYYVPGWAVAIGPRNPARLRATKGSATEQKIARSESVLKN